jgi:hypothetical protein
MVLVSEALQTNRSVAILSPHFPPATLAGVHRARHLAKHLPTHGWSPIIVRVDECHYTERLDPSLASLVPDSVWQVRTGAFPASLARSIGVGDIGLRAFLPLKRALSQLSSIQKLDAVLITGSPFYPLLLTRYVRQVLGVPVVLDFQDPWVSAEGAMRRRWSKGSLAHRLAVALEPRAVRHASFITGVTDRQNAEMSARYPWLDASNMAAIPIGGDPDDFVALRANPPQNPQVRLDTDHINLSYVGAFLPRAIGPVRAVFAALRALREADPALAGRIRLNFVGTSNQPSGKGGHLVMTHAQEENVAGHVLEHPARVPYLEALSLLANSNGLLMIGSDEPHYSASKIYPGLMSGTPYLSMFHAASSAHQILTSAGGGASHCFANLTELAGLVPALTQSLTRLATNPSSFGQADAASYEPFTAREVAGQFARIFERVRM